MMDSTPSSTPYLYVCFPNWLYKISHISFYKLQLELDIVWNRVVTANPRKKSNLTEKNVAYNLSILSANGFRIDLIFEYIANASFPSHGWTNDAYLICFQFTLCAYNVGACHKKYWLDHVLHTCILKRDGYRMSSVYREHINYKDDWRLSSKAVIYCSCICYFVFWLPYIRLWQLCWYQFLSYTSEGMHAVCLQNSSTNMFY